MHQQIGILLQKYIDGSISTAEEKELFGLLRSATNDETFGSVVMEAWQNYQPTDEMPADIDQQIRRKLFAQPATVHRVHFLKRWGWVAAILLLAGAGTWFWFANYQQSVPIVQQTIPAADIQPGSNRARLILADGRTILLDSASNGYLAEQGLVKIHKTADGQLAYEGNKGQAAGFNVIATPRGGQYQVTLPDSSKVWLNALSSIRFPTVFAGNDRTVELDGEAYFEIARNSKKPFIVHTGNGAAIKVLGTSFNVNAYTDEPSVKTTLVTGSVSVASGSQTLIMKQGQQSEMSRDGSIKLTDNANIEADLAWKNGYFYFKGQEIEKIMRHISRWYDVDISMLAKPENKFNSKISREVPLRELLEVFELTGKVRFNIEGRKVTISK